MKLNNEQLKNSNEFLNALFDNITSAIFIVDDETRIRAINDSFKALFHKPEDKIIGELCGNVLGCVFLKNGERCGETENCNSCGLRKSLKEVLNKGLQSNKKKLVREFIIRGKAIKKYFQYSTRIIHVHDEAMVLVIMDDITDLEVNRIKVQQQNDRLAELNIEKNKLMGIAAHDLRNPLGAIKLLAGLMRERKDLSESDREEMISEIESVSAYSLNLVNELLDDQTASEGIISLNIDKQVDVIQLVEDNVSLNQVLADSKQINLQTHLPGFSIYMDIDSSKIQQVMNNLIDNALKYSEIDKNVTVGACLKDDFLKIYVEDEGQGINNEDKERIFEFYERSENVVRKGQKSNGLGLAIAKRIIDAHDGIIDVDSKPGKGSIFWFTLPLQKMPVNF